MSLKNRALALMLSALMLLAPAASFAEAAPVSNYYAGELTTTAMADSYAYGNQVSLDAALGVELTESVDNPKVKALANLLDKAELHMSFYDDFGTARIHAQLGVNGAQLVEANVLVYEDGSVQMMSNLTGKLVLALPAGSVVDGKLDMNAAFGDPYAEMGEKKGAVRQLPLGERLRVTGNDMVALLINHLLGWVSYMQMDNDGEFYTFDDTYLEATETRDPVAQRMIGKIKADSFTTLMWNIATTVCDTQGDFQDAIADLLAELGVTRYQARRFIDSLLTEETIDPALDWVQGSYYIIENKDSSPIQYDDVSYFFKKLQKSTDRIWQHSTDAVLGMTVSYDDFGGMVGFDAQLPQFTTVLPYEGDFTYSMKTDDNWQVKHTAHGEMQVYNDNRVVGDLEVLNGEDIGGVNESYLKGALDVLDQKNATSVGFGVDANLTFEVEALEDGTENEKFGGHVIFSGRENGTGSEAVGATVSGLTTLTPDAFTTYATAMAEVVGMATVVADMTIEQTEVEDIAFPGGQAVDLSALDDAKIETIKNEVMAQGVKLGLSLMAHPDVMADILSLLGQ